MEDKKNDYTIKEEQIARFAKALGHPARVATCIFWQSGRPVILGRYMRNCR